MLNTIESVAKALKNITARLSRGGADSPVYAVNEQAPDKTGNVDLSYMARQDKANTFSALQTFSGGIASIEIPQDADLNTYRTPGWYINRTKSPMFFLQVMSFGSFIIQVKYPFSTAGIIVRRFDTANWNDWQPVAMQSDVPAQIDRGNITEGTDMNTITQPGRYAVVGLSKLVNAPYSDGTAQYAGVVVDKIATIITQDWITTTGKHDFRANSNGWSAWQAPNTTAIQ